MWRFIKYSALASTCLLVGLAGFILIIFFLPFKQSPEDAFRGAVAKPIPASVKNMRASLQGGTGLAGNSALFSFELSPEDFPKILARHHFVEKRPEDLVLPEDVNVFPSLEDPIYFQASYLNGHIKYTIKTNPSRTVVHYFYDKT